jgi:hypothetical protein
MPATKVAKVLQGQEYESVNALFGITVGTAFTIQNQTDGKKFKLSVAAAKPVVNSLAYRLSPSDSDSVIEIPAGNPEVWALGHCQIQAE